METESGLPKARSIPFSRLLADNGGPTLTHLPQSSSPAMDAGDDQECPLTDQRGFDRPFDGDGDGEPICDIGAVEFLSAPAEALLHLVALASIAALARIRWGV